MSFGPPSDYPGGLHPFIPTAQIIAEEEVEELEKKLKVAMDALEDITRMSIGPGDGLAMKDRARQALRYLERGEL